MFFPNFFRLCQVISVLGLAALPAGAWGATVTDDFSISHDYTSGNVSGTIWGGVMSNSGFSGDQNATLLTANSNLSNPGQLTVASRDGDWENNGDDGFFLFRWVNGDFTATVQVVSANEVEFHDMGLMARVGNPADAGSGEDYVAGRYFAAGALTSLRNTDDDSTDNTDEIDLHPFLRLERFGNLFTYTRADNSAFTLNVVSSSVLRSDLEGLALQIGIWQATFTGEEGNAIFDNFSLIESVPEPSAGVLACGGALGFLIRRRRKP